MTSASVLPPGTETPTSVAPPAPVKSTSSPRLVAGAILQLAALGVVGVGVLTMLLSLLATGVGLIAAFGVGLVILAGLAYVLFAVAWVERARVDGLYGFGLPPLRLRRSGLPGFGGAVRTVWRQAIDPHVWRAIANFTIATVFGVIVLTLITTLASGIVLIAQAAVRTAEPMRLVGVGLDVPASWGLGIGIAAVLLSAAGCIGLGLLHGVLSRAILVPSRESLLAEEARTSNRQRAGAVRAADVERTRIERDLHDGVQPRLVSVGMTLGMAQQKIDADPEAAKALIAEAHTSTKAAITELRQLARGIHTSVLDDRGLDAALSALAARSPVPVNLDVRLTQRCSQAAETAAYFVIAESLTNAAKHARANECRVVVRQREGGLLWVRIEDNGIGGATVVPGGGLDGLTNRVLGVGGQFRLDSPVGGPTSVEVSIPCAF